MNKLEQILAEFTKNFVCTDSDEEGKWEYIPDKADIPAQIRRFLADKLIEYKKDLPEIPNYDFHTDLSVEEKIRDGAELFGMHKYKLQIESRIDQDLQSLNKN